MDDLERYRWDLRSKLADEIDDRVFNDIAATVTRCLEMENKSGRLWINAIFDSALTALISVASQMPDVSTPDLIESLRGEADQLQEQKRTLIDRAEAIASDTMMMEADALQAAGEHIQQAQIDERARDAQCKILRTIGEFYLAAASHNSFRPTADVATE